MIVKHINDIRGTSRSVHTDTFESNRLLVRADRVGFSLNHTVLFTGSVTHIWYKHHIEAVYCISGEAEIEMLATGDRFRITPGTLYTLDGHEEHNLHVIKDFECLCVFNPPLAGHEIHDEEGVYPLLEDTEGEAISS